MNLKTWGTVALAAVMVAACAKEPRSGTDSKAGAPAAAREGGAFSSGPTPKHRLKNYDAPLRFEVNVGQTDPQVRFLSRGNGYTLFLTNTGAVFSLAKKMPEGRRPMPATVDVVRMQFAGGNPSTAIDALGPLPSLSHYLVGNDPARWHRNVADYAKVRYRQVYPGIDVVFYGNEGNLEYDFTLAAGVDSRRIGLDLQGVRSTRLTPSGDLVLTTDHGELVQHRPVAYQTLRGQRVAVESRYVVRSSKRIGFELGRHDPTAAVVIDPMLGYGTYLGAEGDDRGEAIAVDAHGNTYVAGMTKSVAFPVQGALQSTLTASSGNAFVAKFDATGSLVFSTYLGGSTEDFATGVAVDASGNVLVSGSTHSADFPLEQAIQPVYGGNGDWFVAKLTPDGSSLVYSTYLGGSGAEKIEYFAPGDAVDGETLALDAGGNAYVTGSTESDDFPTRTSLQATRRGSVDAFVTKFAPDGSLVYSTYLGGSSLDYGHAIAVTADGHAYVAGSTISDDFPTVLGFQPTDPDPPGLMSQDGFVAKLSVDGNSLEYSTYLGGTEGDRIHAIAVDGDGNAYVTGWSSSADFPVVAPIQPCHQFDAFVSKISPAGDTLAYSTCLGGDWSSDAGREDSGFGIAVDSAGRATVVGYTNSDNFPVAQPIQATLHPGGGYPSTYADAFIATFAADGASLEFSTYLGGQGDDYARSVAVDGEGKIYLAGITSSPDMPTRAAMQPQYGSGASVGANDVFVARIDPGTGISIDDVSVGEGYQGQVEATFKVHLSAPTDHPVSFDIATSDGTATGGDDYVPLALTAQTIAPGESEKTFTVEVNGDRTIEQDEAFMVDLSNVTGAVPVDGHAVGTIRNDDVALTIGNVSVVEGNDGEGTELLFPLTLAQPCSQAVTFRVNAREGTAFPSGDYGSRSGWLVTFAPGETSMSLPIEVFGDSEAEPDETVLMTATNADFSGTGYAEGTGTILNDDAELSIADASVVEGNSGTAMGSFTVSLTYPTVNPVAFGFATQNLTAVAGQDYVATSRTGVVIPAGSKSATVSVPITGDTAIEANETFQVAINSTADVFVTDGTATGTILNDDTTLSIGDASILEGDSGTRNAVFTVALAQPSGSPVRFDITTANGTAASGSDYTATHLAGITIPPGSTKTMVSVPVLGDTAIEGAETFQVQVSNVVGATVTDGVATGTILNDDTRLLIGDVKLVEGDSGSQLANFTVSLSNASSRPVTFNIATANGTAAAGSDYTATSRTGITIAAGATKAIVAVPVIGDAAIEGDETFSVLVSNVVGAVLADGAGTGTILNDDTKLSVGDATIGEGNSGTKVLNFPIKLSNASARTVTLNVATANKTAAAGSDYAARSLTGLTIPAGTTSVMFAVNVTGDVAVEADETFLVNASGVNGAIVADAQAVGTIRNDDTVLTVGDASATEGNSGTKSLSFTVRLSAPTAAPVTFNIATANYTALAGSDYLAMSLTGQSIPAGTTSKVFTVALKGDTVREANETFRVNVSSVAGATVGDAQAIGTILNDD